MILLRSIFRKVIGQLNCWRLTGIRYGFGCSDWLLRLAWLVLDSWSESSARHSNWFVTKTCIKWTCFTIPIENMLHQLNIFSIFWTNTRMDVMYWIISIKFFTTSYLSIVEIYMKTTFLWYRACRQFRLRIIYHGLKYVKTMSPLVG